MSRLAFLIDITGHLNKLKKKLQGRGQFVNVMYEHVVMFQLMLGLCNTQLDQGNLVQHAKKTCCMFGSTYLCKSLFSKMKYAKSRLQSQITDQHLEGNMRLSTSTILPNIEKLAKDMQHQVAH